MGSHLYDLIILPKFIKLHVLVAISTLSSSTNIVHVKFFEDLSHNQIEDGDDICWVVFNLAVQSLIELEEMVTVDIEDIKVKIPDLLQLLNIVRGLAECFIIHVIVIIIVLDLLKVVDKVLELGLNITGVNIGSPNDLGCRAHLISLHLAIEHTC